MKDSKSKRWATVNIDIDSDLEGHWFYVGQWKCVAHKMTPKEALESTLEAARVSGKPTTELTLYKKPARRK